MFAERDPLQAMHFDLGSTHTVMVYELNGEALEKDPVSPPPSQRETFLLTT